MLVEPVASVKERLGAMSRESILCPGDPMVYVKGTGGNEKKNHYLLLLDLCPLYGLQLMLET